MIVETEFMTHSSVLWRVGIVGARNVSTDCVEIVDEFIVLLFIILVCEVHTKICDDVTCELQKYSFTLIGCKTSE